MFSYFKKKLIYIYNILSGRFRHIKIQIDCKSTWYGNDYGGFYICPFFVNENSIIYSFGIGEDISFDKAVIKNHRSKVFAFDPTPKSNFFIKNETGIEHFHFFNFGISSKSGLVDFYLPKKSLNVSGSMVKHTNVNYNAHIKAEMKSISDIMHELGHNHIDVLKMDIEGSEYDVLEDVLNSNISVTQIVVEFHERFFKDGATKTKYILNKLSLNGFKLFAVSDSFEELSFINTKYFQ